MMETLSCICGFETPAVEDGDHDLGLLHAHQEFCKPHTTCIICATQLDDHPTERNNPAPLATDGYACRSCNSFVTAARAFPVGVPQDTLTFLQMAFSLQAINKQALALMNQEMARLEQKQTEREEDYGVLLGGEDEEDDCL